MRNFRLAYFFLPISSSPMTTLKQCLHFDPDSKPCLSAHRFVKSVDKTMSKLDALLGSENWSAALKLLIGKDEDGLVFTFDKALEDHTSAKENLIDTSSSLANSAPLPNAKRTSPRRAEILRRTCRAYIRLNDIKHGIRWCEALLSMEGEEEDGDGLVGRGEAQLSQEDYEAAVRTFEKAFEVTGRSRRDVSIV
jgi:DnaJ homolog subfamily C member 3